MSKDPAKISAFYEKIFGWKSTCPKWITAWSKPAARAALTAAS
jgi:predicted enzyme related to lactoylglutathione lyase